MCVSCWCAEIAARLLSKRDARRTHLLKSFAHDNTSTVLRTAPLPPETSEIEVKQ